MGIELVKFHVRRASEEKQNERYFLTTQNWIYCELYVDNEDIIARSVLQSYVLLVVACRVRKGFVRDSLLMVLIAWVDT